GCQPAALEQIVLRELVDNAHDAGAEVTLTENWDTGTWIISDNGPGIESSGRPAPGA
ncbi:MAG: hypothetical protein JO212_00455, partial [Acetobacteraceae bacterium]|nr:hypothetical protein [Acetobacteraceae bacterium]